MRLSLFAAVAAAPLLFVIPAAAIAATTVSAASTNALSTSTADGGAPSDIVITSDGTVEPAGGSAITIDSGNSVENGGAIKIDGYDGAVGILVSGPVTSTLNNIGSITIGDNYTATDSLNADGVIEAPFAAGTGRYGVRVLGAFTGSISNSGSISVRGNESYALAIDAPLFGNVLSTGGLSLTGDNGAAFRNTAPVTGSLQFAGGVAATGQNSQGIDIAAPVSGSLSIYSTVSTTGYAMASRPTTSASLAAIQATAEDMQQGGSALRIQSSIGGGIFIAAPPAGTTADTTDDLDGDGVADGVEGTASVAAYGAAPAISIGGAAPITIGNFGSGQNAFGLIVRGSVTANGVYDGVSATGIDIGVGNAGVDMSGGVRIVGSVTTNAYDAGASGIALQSGAKVDVLENAGAISTTVTGSSAAIATGLRVDAGASLPSLVNYGTLSASMVGNLGSAAAVVDHSGTLAFVENTGTISAVVTPAATGDATAGSGIALDLRANTSGILLRQELNGTVSPVITGDIYLGSGTNTVQFLSGTVTGALDLGSGINSSLLIAGGASYTGALSYSGSGLSLNIDSGSLTNTSTAALSLASLTVGGSGVLNLAVDPAANVATLLNVSGTATLAQGSALGISLLSAPTGTHTFTLIKAGQLVVPAGQSVLSITTPYLFSAAGRVDTAAGEITIDVRRRSTEEMDLNRSEAGALDATYAALDKGSSLRGVIFAAETRADFLAAYDQMLPDHAGGVFQVTTQLSSEIGRAIAGDALTDSDTGVLVWLQEIAVIMDQARGDGEAYRAFLGGLVGGLAVTGPNQQIGITIAGAASEVKPSDRPSSNQVSVSNFDLGLYWRGNLGGLLADARVSAGYVSVQNNRAFAATLDTTSVTRVAKGQWSGYDTSARAGLSYPITIGRAYLRPQVSAERVTLHEDGYAETGGGDGFDLVVQSRETSANRTTASVVAGWNFGSDFIWRPEIEVGRAQVQSSDGVTTARFAYGGDSFTVFPNALTGSSNIARFRLNGVGKSVQMAFEAGGEFQDGYTAATARASVQFPF